jgi:hypothetical protein
MEKKVSNLTRLANKTFSSQPSEDFVKLDRLPHLI